MPDAYGFWSLLPPLVAIVLAVWWKNVFPALFAGIWVGTTILAGGNPVTGLLRLFDEHLIASLGDADHIKVILFTLFLGAMIGVMSRSGGSTAVVQWLSHYVHNRRSGQVVTWLAGLFVFFDDYANALLVGGTMRPLTDRLKISREKLAFLIDATAAPVAGLAIVSTWAASEIDWIAGGFEEIGQEVNAFELFVATLPYRFYPILMLGFVFAIAWTGRDFGAMRQAELHCRRSPEHDPHAGGEEHDDPQTLRMQHALIPLAVLLTSLGVGLWLDFDNSSQVLVIASFSASAAGVISVLATRTRTLSEAVDDWIEGAKSMFLALMILSMAWMISAVCKPDKLDTAGYLVSLVGDWLSPQWLPTISFLLSAVVSFSTGSSFATMGLLIPLFTSLSWQILGQGGAVPVDDPLLLATIGSVLAGSIFGDHCSPISDTTVLSSAASGCDHLSHVATQMPYALSVGAVTLLLGSVPVGFGLNVWLCLLLQGAGLVWLVTAVGQQVEETEGDEPAGAEEPIAPALSPERSE